jgi:PAS domain S-box-containing protein
VIFVRPIHSQSGVFIGAVAAALEPEYFRVLLRSILYAPDMWVALGHGDGKVFVTMPEDTRRIEGESQPLIAAFGRDRDASDGRIVLGPLGGAGEARITALGRIAPPPLHMDQPLVIAVSRSTAEVNAPWRQQAFAYLTFFACSAPAPRSASTAASGGASRTRLLEASAERERRKNAEQLGLALEGAELGLWDWDVRHDRFTSNEVMRGQLGYAPGEIGDSGDAWRRIVHRDDAEKLISAIEAHFRRETPSYECEFRVRHKDGHWVWLLSRGKVVERDSDDTPVRMAGTHMDLTRRIRTEAEVQRTAEMLRRTGELANIGGWELDLATMQVEWSEQVFRIHELPPGPSPRLEETMQYYDPTGRQALQGGDRGGRRAMASRGTSSCRS